MITAVDTSILLDILLPDPEFGQHSKTAVRSAIAEGQLVACDIVWAEIAGFFHSPQEAREVLERISLEFSPITLDSALAAGKVWKEYRKRGGNRDRMVADFLIGAHCQCQADRLLTRDRGFYRSFFPRLKLLNPAAR